MRNGSIVVFDLDGTLALIDHRRHLVEGDSKDWGAFYRACVDDEPNLPVIDLFHRYREDRRLQLWIVSGRSDEVHEQTVDWLVKHEIRPHALLMRKEGDYTPDDELKRQWILPHLSQVVLAVDDRDKVVRMWRGLGIPCFQVANGDF